ncbi:MAG TPA: hypothetical protein EYG46_18590 [Myxococcales bacterium]|nr:hypothetical protein [Myxococcales bacterium]
MKSILRGAGYVLLALVVVGIAVSTFARFQDGPVGAVAGGALTSGDWVETAGLDWSFAANVDTIEFQLLAPPRSRTVWIVYHDNSLFIPCALPNFTLWKQWPHEALADGRAIIRIDGKRYAVNLVKTEDPGHLGAVLDLVGKKYGSTGPDDQDLSNLVWAFRLVPRPADDRTPGLV